MISGVGLFLVAVGAILKWGINASASGFNLDTIGTILMIVGAIGAIASLAFWNGPLSTSRRTVVSQDPVTGRRTAVEDDRYAV